MNREKFLRELSRALKRLPEAEREAALTWYGEYFDEAGEEQALKALGTPKETAARIAGELALKREDGQQTRAISLWTLALLSFPISAPLAAVALAVLLSVAGSCLAVAVSLMAAGVACAATGMITLVQLMLSQGAGVGTQLTAGISLAAMGVGGLLIVLVAKGARRLYRAAKNALAKKMTRGKPQ